MKNLARSCLIRRGLDVLASVFYHQARNKITAPSRSPPSKKYKKGIMAGPPKTLPKRLKNMKTSGQSQVIEVSSKSAEGPTSKQTKNSYKTNYLSDSKVINPKWPFTSKKNQQVHVNAFKLKVISWPFELASTQQQNTNHFHITQTTLSQWVKQHERLCNLVLKNGGRVKRIRPEESPVLPSFPGQYRLMCIRSRSTTPFWRRSPFN